MKNICVMHTTIINSGLVASPWVVYTSHAVEVENKVPLLGDSCLIIKGASWFSKVKKE